jgi:hypothetical protein
MEKSLDQGEAPLVSSTVPDGGDVDSKDGTETTTPPSQAVPPPVDAETKQPEWATGLRLLNIMVAITCVCFLMLLDGTIVVAAVPRITDDFNSLNDIGWYGAAYQLGRYNALSEKSSNIEADCVAAPSFNRSPAKCT